MSKEKVNNVQDSGKSSSSDKPSTVLDVEEFSRALIRLACQSSNNSKEFRF